jgi:hypothetical protein
MEIARSCIVRLSGVGSGVVERVAVLVEGEVVKTVMVAGPDWSLVRETVIATAGLWYLSRGRYSRQNLLFVISRQ